MRAPKVILKELTNSKLKLTFETGEDRFFQVDRLLADLNDTGVAIFSLNDIKQCIISEGILVFPSVKIKVPTPQGVKTLPFDLDPNYTYGYSESKELSVGDAFRLIRRRRGLTQEDIAEKCGTDKAYISRFEQNKIQVEWTSVRKLFFMGLNIKVSPNNIIPMEVQRGKPSLQSIP